MLYNLIRTDAVEAWLVEQGLYGLARPLTYPEFRAIAAIVVSFFLVVLLGQRVIYWLAKAKLGDVPEFHDEHLNELFKDKANVPTMGGVLISGAIGFTTLLLADVTSFYIQMGMLCLLWLTALGGADDWLKLTTAKQEEGSRDGLIPWEKLAFQVALAGLLGYFIHQHGVSKHIFDFHDMSKMTHCLNLPAVKTWVWDPLVQDFVTSPQLIVLPAWLFILLTIFIITGFSNAVNLTDGMDGLASGITSICAFAFMVLALIAGREEWSKFLLVPYVPLSDELAIVAGAMAGSCMGFMWYNCNPATVFMGDTGSLSLGGMLGYIAIVTRQEVLLLVIGGVFVLEAVSVILQVGYFKWSGGKRIFRCAPIHHHFQKVGWAENQVVTRFWLATLLLAAIALATLKLR